MTTLYKEATSPNTININCRTPGVKDRQAGIHRAVSAASMKLALLCKTISKYIATRYNQRIDRQAFEQMHRLDDRMLKDLGITRQDVKWASRLPLSEDAHARLEILDRRPY